MDKSIKEALKKGKVLREKLHEERKQEAKKQKELQEAEALKKKKELQEEAERHLARIPEALTYAVSVKKDSFTLMSYNLSYKEKFNALVEIMAPRIVKLGLKYKISKSTSWTQGGFDPDWGYDESWNDLDILVPEEGL